MRRVVLYICISLTSVFIKASRTQPAPSATLHCALNEKAAVHRCCREWEEYLNPLCKYTCALFEITPKLDRWKFLKVSCSIEYLTQCQLVTYPLVACTLNLLHILFCNTSVECWMFQNNLLQIYGQPHWRVEKKMLTWETWELMVSGRPKVKGCCIQTPCSKCFTWQFGLSFLKVLIRTINKGYR